MERVCQSPVIDVIQNVCQAWDAQCSITRWNTKKRVENTTHSRVFLTNFEMFHLVMKHFVECLLLLLKQKHLEGEIKDARMSSLSSDHQTLVKH